MIAVELAEEDAVELFELLGLVADLCSARHGVVSVALAAVVGSGYDAAELGADARRLGAAFGQALGLGPPCPHPHVFADMDCGGPR